MALFQLQRSRSQSPERRQLLEIFTHVLYGLDGSDEALVFKCSERIYAEAPELVMRCFVDENGIIGHLNIYHVTNHLLALAKDQASVFERNRLAIEYLKIVAPHVAGSALSQSAEYNIPQRLAALYIETIVALGQEPGTAEQAEMLRRELQELLQSSEQCLPETLLTMLPAEGMQRERCVGVAERCVADAPGEAASTRGGAATAAGRAAAAGDGVRVLRRGGGERLRGRRRRVSDAAESVRERRV